MYYFVVKLIDGNIWLNYLYLLLNFTFSFSFSLRLVLNLVLSLSIIDYNFILFLLLLWYDDLLFVFVIIIGNDRLWVIILRFHVSDFKYYGLFVGDFLAIRLDVACIDCEVPESDRPGF